MITKKEIKRFKELLIGRQPKDEEEYAKLYQKIIAHTYELDLTKLFPTILLEYICAYESNQEIPPIPHEWPAAWRELTMLLEDMTS